MKTYFFVSHHSSHFYFYSWQFALFFCCLNTSGTYFIYFIFLHVRRHSHRDWGVCLDMRKTFPYLMVVINVRRVNWFKFISFRGNNKCEFSMEITEIKFLKKNRNGGIRCHKTFFYSHRIAWESESEQKGGEKMLIVMNVKPWITLKVTLCDED